MFGPYTSGEDGRITEAYLIEGRDYLLTETKAPHEYYGLQAPVTICLDNGTVSATPGTGENWCCEVNPSANGNSPVVQIKNRAMTFRVIKKGGEELDTATELGGVKFALYEEKTVGGVTIIDVTSPMMGFDSLLTGDDGVVPQVDQTLPAASYELHEKEAPDGYQSLSLPQIKFSISQLGAVTLDKEIDGVQLTCDTETTPGTAAYTMEMLNHPVVDLKIVKSVTGEVGDQTKDFTFRLVSVENQTHGTMYAWIKYDANGHIIGSTDSTIDSTPETPLSTKAGKNTFILQHNQYIVIEVPRNKTIVVEEVIGASEGYSTSWSVIGDSSQAGSTPEMNLKLTDNATVTVVNSKGEFYPAPTGYTVTVAPYLFMLVLGSLLLALAGRRKTSGGKGGGAD